MEKFKEKIKNICKNKVFVSILLLTLCIFSLLSGLNGSKTGDIKANALSKVPANKAIDLNGITYEYQTSLNELNNNYNLFNFWNYNNILKISTDTEGVTVAQLSAVADDSINSAQNNTNEIEELIRTSFFFHIENEETGGLWVNSVASFDDTSTDTSNLNAYYDIENISFTSQNITKIRINFNNLKQKLLLFDTEYFVGLQYTKDNLPNIENETVLNNSIFLSYSLSNFPNDFSFDVIKYEGYSLRNLYCSTNDKTEKNENNSIYNSVPNGGLGKDFYLEEKYINLENINFILNSDNNNIIRANFSFTQTTNYPTYKGNILLSENKYDETLFSQLASPTYIDPVYQNIGRGFFGGYSEDKPSRNGFYYRSIATIGLGGVGAYFNKEGSPLNYKNESLFYAFDYLGGNNGFEIKYNNQNQLLYLQDATDLRADFDDKKYSGLSAQVEDVLYNVSIQNQAQNELNNDIKEDFVNLLKTSALGTFFGLIWGLFTGNPALGAVIGGSIGALLGVIPLIIDALQSLVGSSPALSTIYNLFKSITMLFVDIFDAIINFALNFITNPIVLILVVVAVLVYIFVVRKFKK